MWRSAWSRGDAVGLFGEAAVAALEQQAPFPAPLRACRSGPFSWVETCADLKAHDGATLGFGSDAVDLYFWHRGWEVRRRGEEALKMAVEMAMPSRDDVEIIVDVAARLTGWVIVDEHRGAQEPPHYEGAAVSFCALRQRPDAPACGSRNSLWRSGGWDDRGVRGWRERPRVEVYCDLLRIVVDTESCSVHIAIIE